MMSIHASAGMHRAYPLKIFGALSAA